MCVCVCVCVCVCAVVDRWNLVVCMPGPLTGVMSLAVFVWSMRFSNREIKRTKQAYFSLSHYFISDCIDKDVKRNKISSFNFCLKSVLSTVCPQFYILFLWPVLSATTSATCPK